MLEGRSVTILGLGFEVVGAFFLARGVLKMAPDTIALLSMARFGFNYDVVKSLAGQRAAFEVGFALLILGFVFPSGWSFAVL